MADTKMTDEQLAMVLQASRDFALEQMARGDRLLPFATRVQKDGEIAFARFTNEDTQDSLEVVYAATQRAIAEEASSDGLLAAALVSAVAIDPPQGDCSQAIRIHLEAPGYCAQVLAPFAIVEGEGDDAKPNLKLGEMIPNPSEVVLFTA